MKPPSIGALAAATVVLGLGFVGSQAMLSGLAGWYSVATKPAWALPIPLYVPVWTALHVLVALAAALAADGSAGKARLLLLAQVAFFVAAQGFWCVRLFGVGGTLAAPFLAIGSLFIAIVTAFTAFRQSRAAGVLIASALPILGYFVALSFALDRLNR